MAKKKSIQDQVADANEQAQEQGMEHFMKIKTDVSVKEAEMKGEVMPCASNYNQGSIAEKKYKAPQPWKPKGRK